MKKLLILIAVILYASINLGAQSLNVQKKNVESFSEVSAEDYFVLKFFKSDVCSVTIRSDVRISDYVQAYVKGGTLYLSLDEKKFPSELKKTLRKKGVATPVLEVDVYMPVVNSLILSENAVLVGTDRFEVANFTADITDHAQIAQLNIDCSNADFKVSRSASLSASVNVTTKLSLNASNSSRVSLTQTGGNVFMEHSNSAYVDYRAAVTTFEVNSSGGSESHISGTASLLKVTGAGLSRVDAELLESLDGEVSLNGSKCHVNITESLKVNLNGGAMLTFKRKPVFEIERILNSTLITADDEKRK